MTPSHRVSRCGASVLAGVAALSLAACGSSATSPAASSAASKPPTSSSASATAAAPSSKPPVADGRDRTVGVVGSVSGSTITLTAPRGPATVDLTPTTRVRQLTGGQLSDVTAGECLVARPTKETAGTAAVTAVAVLFGAVENGQCVPPGGNKGRGAIGTVASVTGSTITLTTGTNTQATVTVTPDTRYAKRSTADPSVIAAGQCLMAQGAKVNDATLQATTVNVRPSDNGKCGGGRQG